MGCDAMCGSVCKRKVISAICDALMMAYHTMLKDWMNDLPLAEELGYVNNLCIALAIFFSFSAVALLAGLTAPYGRYYRGGVWGCLIPGKPAWIIQELPNLIMVVFCVYVVDGRPEEKTTARPNQVLLGFFCFHYVYRTLIFPLRIRGGKPTAFVPFAMAFAFCTVNGYLQGRALTYLYAYPDSWLRTPQFLAGSVIFGVGWLTNFYHDSILINLRKQTSKNDDDKTGYKIPTGGLFEYVSGANFLGEIIEWTGFAIACWNLPAACFAVTTLFNIGPRAIQHHRWYLDHFKDRYPPQRRALIPFVL